MPPLCAPQVFGALPFGPFSSNAVARWMGGSLGLDAASGRLLAPGVSVSFLVNPPPVWTRETPVRSTPTFSLFRCLAVDFLLSADVFQTLPFRPSVSVGVRTRRPPPVILWSVSRTSVPLFQTLPSVSVPRRSSTGEIVPLVGAQLSPFRSEIYPGAPSIFANCHMLQSAAFRSQS